MVRARLGFAAAVAVAVGVACSSSGDAKPDASAAPPRSDAAVIPDLPVNEIVDGGSCPDPYPGPGPELLTRTPALDRGVAAIYAIRPDLKYINKVKREYPGGDGPRILPFVVDGGFDVVMINAAGDCSSVCTMFEYWYFEVRGSDLSPTAADVGHYLPPKPSTACDERAGTPMWNSPLDRPCDDGGAPAPAITGTRAFCATGTLGTCTTATKTTRNLTIDFGADSVTVHGTGNASLDEQTFPATYSRNHVDVALVPPAGTSPSTKVTMRFDFAAGSNGTMEVVEMTGCTPDGCTCTASTHFALSAP